jgi:hypothetical protein
VSYAAQYQITPGLKGYRVWEWNKDLDRWDQLVIDFKSWEEAEAGVLRLASKEVRRYSESGEAV